MLKKVNLPIILMFEDYHEIAPMKEYLKKIIPGIRGEEIYTEKYGFQFYGEYPGLFWDKTIGKPNKTTIQAMLEKLEHGILEGKENEDA